MNSFSLNSHINPYMPVILASSLSSSSAYSSGFESASDSIDFVYESESSTSAALNLHTTHSHLRDEQQDCQMDSDQSSVNCSQQQMIPQFDYEYFDQQPFGSSNCELWQFLLELLEDKRNRHLIRWVNTSTSTSPSSTHTPQPTSLAVPLHQIQNEKSTAVTVVSAASSPLHDNEFMIVDSIEVARQFALRRNKPSMTYTKFNRILRSYYNKKKILHKTAGKTNVFAFQINIHPYLGQIRFNLLMQQHRIQEYLSMKLH
jgi:hypothetical protein